MLGICITQHYTIKYFWAFQLNELLSQLTSLSYIFWQTPSPTSRTFFDFYGPETSVKNMMYPAVKPSCIEITNALRIVKGKLHPQIKNWSAYKKYEYVYFGNRYIKSTIK